MERDSANAPSQALAESAMGDPILPVGVDTSIPSVARTYDYMLGGKDNFTVDREIGDQLFELAPDATAAALENRKILARAVHYLGTQGIRQFLDLGSGLPTQDNVHQITQRHFPDSRVVYVDNDPIVLAHGRALLADNDQTVVITADMLDHDAIIGHPDTQRFIDFTQPVGVLLCGILHHFTDDQDPSAIVTRLRDAVPSGSYVFITHFCSGTELAAEVERILLQDLGSGRFRTREEIEEFFAGWDLVSPGVTYLPLWRPDEPRRGEPTDLEKFMAGGVGRKP